MPVFVEAGRDRDCFGGRMVLVFVLKDEELPVTGAFTLIKCFSVLVEALVMPVVGGLPELNPLTTLTGD